MLKQMIRDFKSQIEAGLIGAVIVLLLVNIFSFTGNGSLENTMMKLSMLAMVLLSIFYIYISDKQILFIACLALFAVSLINSVFSDESLTRISEYFSVGSFVLSAITIGILCLKHSREYKNFETMEGILALFLLITASRYFVETDYSQYYSFGICFLIATLMYNNNLWERYKPSERNLLMFLLVYFFAEVIKVSGNYISL